MARIRFAPPPGHPDPERRWILMRAFGPAPAPAPTPVPTGGLAPIGAPIGAPSRPFDAESVLASSRALFLAARIGARHRAAHLASELGGGPDAAAAAAGFAADHRGAIARTLLLDELAAELAGVARSLGLPVALLKFAALYATGALLPGGRLASDVDVLVPAKRAAELHDALLGRGFAASGLSAYEHQLPLISHPRLGAVEIHLHLPGLVPPGGHGYAVLEDLEAAGALRPVAAPPTSATTPAAAGGLRAPSRPVLLAHALAHGLLQHGWAPEAYPPFRMVSDLVDLGLGGPDGEALLEAGLPWLTAGRDRGSHPGLDPGEARATRELCARLVAGRLPDTGGTPDAAGTLLGHFLAGALDPGYRRSLGLRRLAGAPTEDRGTSLERAAAWRRRIVKALVPTRAEVDAIYRRRHGRAGYLARIAARPFDLAWRLARALAGWLAVRFRR